MMQNLDELEGKGFEFPTEYPVKAMGPNHDDFELDVVETIKQHAPEVSRNSVNTKTSSTGKYRSVTVLVYAQSKDHLIAIYKDIRAIKDVMWTL
ncbi:DUF493 domain-containing protein [Marinicella sp. S1101]|uniref:YbeD family protein n=1 Tax=Marinicella marina TaxID=2996016 RepID=UPI002260CF3A|nr:DUF493 domain-containing protein [Marinicella marina]MCX7552519.1 DUF493 domain-containing protein [Marinicella marina]MDJ1139395.1 DUF493 domain-containing protein [Marinicella marina]